MDSYVAERPTAAVERREHLFIAHVIPGDESNGPLAAAVTTFRGWPDPTKDNYAALIKKVHPDTPRDTIFNQAEDARKIVRQEIWHVIDETSPRN